MNANTSNLGVWSGNSMNSPRRIGQLSMHPNNDLVSDLDNLMMHQNEKQSVIESPRNLKE